MTSLNEKQIVDIFVNNFRRSNRMITGGFRSRQYYTAKPIGEDDVSIITPARSLNRGMKLIFKCDTLVESTDVPQGMKAWQIARKSIVSCVSDLAAKGIKPPYMSMISLGIPAGYSKDDLLELVKGFKKSSREFGIEFIGGDTNEASELIIGCALIGFSKSGNIPTRNGAKPGDYIIVSGTFGYPSAGLEILTQGAGAREMFRNRAISSVMSPKPQQKFGTLLARYLSSSIDSSDGLAISLYELALRSKLDFFVSITPTARGIMQFVTENKFLDFHELIFHGGEEFHIVATVSRQNLKRAENMARKQKLKLIVIGKATSGTGKVFITSKHKLKKELSLLDNRGYLHFQNKSKV
jgi:thiamine-monophosphate kinase